MDKLENKIIDPEISSTKSFAFVFFLVFTLAATYFFAIGNLFGALGFLAAALIVILTWRFSPNALDRPNLWWHKLGLLLGKIVGPLVMAAVYLLAIMPVGIIMHIMRRDGLRIKKRDVTSYWISREKEPESMDRQY